MEKERIDVVVNNAGYDLIEPLEETSMDEIKAQFETNFFGAIRAMQDVLPLRKYQLLQSCTSLRLYYQLQTLYFLDYKQFHYF